MAKNNKHTERMAKSDRNVNRAMILLMVGLIAEFYLLMVTITSSRALWDRS